MRFALFNEQELINQQTIKNTMSNYTHKKRLHKRVMEIGRTVNPKLKSISSSSFEEIDLEIEALLINLVTKSGKTGSRLNIKRKPLRKPNTGKASHGDQVSDQMLSQLSVVEGLLRRTANLERGQEYFMQKIARLSQELNRLKGGE